MTRSKQMQPVLQLAESRKTEAATALGKQVQVLEQASQQLQDLLRYRQEYSQQLSQAQGRVDVFRLQEQRAFMAKLSAAIQQQQAVVERHKGQLKKLRAQWMEKHKETQALDHLLENYKQQERRQADVREQKTLEDIVTGRYANRDNNGFS